MPAEVRKRQCMAILHRSVRLPPPHRSHREPGQWISRFFVPLSAVGGQWSGVTPSITDSSCPAFLEFDYTDLWDSLPRSSVYMADCRRQLTLLTMCGRSTGCRRSHTKDQCAISSGLIRMTVVGGVSLLAAPAIHSDKTFRRLSITTTV